MRTDPDAWSLVLAPGQVDARTLLTALQRLVVAADYDYRSRLLTHEALVTLAGRWGAAGLDRRLAGCENAGLLREAWRASFDETGFPYLKDQIVDATTPDTVLGLFRELGSRLRRPATITVGGSSALILADLLTRLTQDVDVVNELPDAVRSDPALVDELGRRYRLRLAHFASHYLPDRWEGRTHSVGVFDRLDVRAVDSLDVLAGKLFSRRTKDLDDIRAAWPRVDPAALRSRVAANTTGLRNDAALAEVAARNWYILTGDAGLP